MQNKWTHIPILAREIANLLLTDLSGTYLDGTLGLGGHSKYFLGRLDKGARIVGFDKDEQAIKMAVENIADPRLIPYNLSYLDAEKVFKEAGYGAVNGALFDLGLSSYQLDDAARGFSFQQEGPLDMRFDAKQQLSAQVIVNSWGYDAIEDILKRYGGEGFAPKITAAIIMRRREKPFETTLELAKLIESICPRSGKLHPATRTFQALRIAVNDELACVEKLPSLLPSIIKVGGRAAVLTFHSTEDRIIKYAFKELAATGNWQLVNKKVIEPAFEEVKANPRARSAKLRVIERVA